MHAAPTKQHPGSPDDPCNGTVVVTGIHEHPLARLNITPICHQDDVINTVIQSGDPAFQYSFQVPANDSPECTGTIRMCMATQRRRWTAERPAPSLLKVAFRGRRACQNACS